MRPVIALCLLAVLVPALAVSLAEIPFGNSRAMTSEKPGKYYVTEGGEETGAANIVTSVVVTYRGFDTLGEVTVLFIAAIGLGAVLFTKPKEKQARLQEASLILQTGCHFLFPLIMIFGAYVFTHGLLNPGGGFQGGVIIASGFLMVYLGCADMKVRKTWLNATESLAGSAFVIAGLIGLALGGDFLMNFLPKGTFNTFFSAGLIPIIYAAIGFKVGAELAGVIANLLERPE